MAHAVPASHALPDIATRLTRHCLTSLTRHCQHALPDIANMPYPTLPYMSYPMIALNLRSHATEGTHERRRHSPPLQGEGQGWGLYI